MTITLKHAVALLGLASALPLHAAPVPRADANAEFAKPRLVDIGGRRLHLYCSGAGPVTVLFDAHGGAAGWSWFQVQPEVARHTRACVYDRAGLGFSDPQARPATAGNAADDLKRLLAAAGIAPPYVMVGSSLGGAVVQLYAYRHPTEIKGLVLVEGHREDEIARADRATGGKYMQMIAQYKQMMAACHAQAVAGFAPGSDARTQCVGSSDPRLGRHLGAQQLASRLSAGYWQAMVNEVDSLDAGDAELRAARKPFGALPLVVLARTVNPFAAPGKPSPLVKAMEAENLKMQRETAALSTSGEVRVVRGAGHVVHETHPQAVVKAVLDVLAQASR